DQPDRFHRTEAKRIDAAMRHDLDRQAPLEELLLFEVVNGRRLAMHERIIEPFVFFPRQRAVQIVPVPIVDTAGNGGSRAVRSCCTSAIPSTLRNVCTLEPPQ